MSIIPIDPCSGCELIKSGNPCEECRKDTEIMREPDYYGEIAYEAYREKSNKRSLVTGEELPEWFKLPFMIKEAWIAAANAILKFK